jgi:hypothetical protein
MRLAGEEAPERHLGAEQRARKETALEITPGVQNVLRVHAGGDTRAALGAPAHFTAGRMCGLESVAPVQQLVAQVRGEVELEARRVGLQLAIQVHGVRGFEKGTHHAAQLAIVVAREHGLPVEPAQRQSVVPAQAHQVVDTEREFSLAHAFR